MQLYLNVSTDKSLATLLLLVLFGGPGALEYDLVLMWKYIVLISGILKLKINSQ